MNKMMSSSHKPSDTYQYLQKCIVIGDAGSGKSSVLARYTDGSFSSSYVSTIGVDFRIKAVTHNNKTVKMQLWDTAGQERFRTITTSYYRGAQAIFIIFDLTDRSSFESVERWHSDAERYSQEDVPKIIIGNKSDMQNDRVVTTEEAQALADQLGSKYFEVSAKVGTNVEEAFRSSVIDFVKKQSVDLVAESNNFCAVPKVDSDSEYIRDPDLPDDLEPIPVGSGQFLPPKLIRVPGSDMAGWAEGTLSAPVVSSLVTGWLQEDCPTIAVSLAIVAGDLDKEETAVIKAKSKGVLAGRAFVNEIFKQLGCEVTWLVSEGDNFRSMTELARVTGLPSKLIQGERVALNLLSRSCGVATVARSLCTIAVKQEWKGRIACTRKTTPGFRVVEKYAVLIGGMDTHRFNMDDMVMIKDNHIKVLTDIKSAVSAAKCLASFSKKVEIEVSNIDDAMAAASVGCDIIMFDNMEGKSANDAAKQVKEKYPTVLIEVSGNITSQNIDQYMLPFIDIISTSEPIQGYPTVDINMKIQ